MLLFHGIFADGFRICEKILVNGVDGTRENKGFCKVKVQFCFTLIRLCVFCAY